MIFDKLRQASTAIGSGYCSKDVPAMEFNGEGRRRMRLRRIRPVVEDPVVTSDYDVVSSKKKRLEKLLTDNDASVYAGGGEDDRRSYGLVSVIGRRREMEDAATAELEFLRRGERRYDFFGVYDGHGGQRVAEACRESLHKVVGMLAEEQSAEGIDWGRVMAWGFRKVDEEVNREGKSVATMGSTAVVAVVGDEEVVVANCGDSRAVLCRGGAAVPLSNDHKPNRADELERIENSGGKVVNWNGLRVLGVLATSRSIGDLYLKPYIISEPEVKRLERSEFDEFLILASDGLWDVVSNDVACQVVRRCLHEEPRSSYPKLPNGTKADGSRASEAAAILIELAMSRGSSDNITVIVVDLKQS